MAKHTVTKRGLLLQVADIKKTVKELDFSQETLDEIYRKLNNALGYCYSNKIEAKK